MKKILQYSFLTAFLVFSAGTCLNAQPHAGQQSTGSVTGDRIGAGAGVPVGGGTLLLIGLACLYGGKKIFDDYESIE
ncbi:MAG: hypothetical protein Q7U54_04380 [Bacteroidales bacterium]|nr:hypothetical protein [Bacteroidales bacterium]